MDLPIPPAHGYPDDDGEERPPFVLIETYAYFADRDNATTAACLMDGFKGEFKFTFCTAGPPLISYMCFEATPYGDTPFAVEPEIIATETGGGLVLLRLVFGKHPTTIMYPHNRQYLVYDASGPSLEHLPHPGQHRFCDESVAFVRKCTHGDSHDCSSKCDYVFAGHSGGFGDAGPYQLCLYHSITRTWQQTEMVLKPSPFPGPSHSTCKAITIGGDKGTVAWVDLWHNILLCDVLADRRELRSLRLPPPILSTHEVRRGNPRSLRDIALIDGFFKYVQIEPGSCALGRWEWEVRVWSAKTTSSLAKDWIVEHKLKSCEISEPSLPMMLQVGQGQAQPTLSTLQIGLPNLSLQDAGIVYFLSKVDYRDNENTAWVLAVDMRSKTIQKVGEFSTARTLGLAKGYDASRISRYLKGTKQTTRDAALLKIL